MTMSKLTYRVEIDVSDDGFSELKVAELLMYVGRRLNAGADGAMRLYGDNGERVGYAGYFDGGE